MSSIEWFFRKTPMQLLDQENARLAAESAEKERTIQRLYTGSLKDMHEMNALTARVADLEAHLRTIAKFGGTLDQARELAAKGIERAALLAKEGNHEGV